MFTIAICDDQDGQLELVKEALRRYSAASDNISFEVRSFSDPAAFLSELRRTGGWDIVILDVCMPGFSGTDLAREIRERHDRTEIIFVSFSRDYAVDAFSVNASHYLVKPFTQEEFSEAMDRAVSAFLSAKRCKIPIQIGNGAVRSLDINDIIYIESVSYHRVVHTASDTYEESRMTLSKFEETLDSLSPGQFIQPYRGYIVNLDAVKTITTSRIILQNGDAIIIKRGDFRRLRELFFKWSFRNRDSV